MSQHTLYRDGVPVAVVEIPDDVIAAAQKVSAYLVNHQGAELMGLGVVAPLQRQLADAHITCSQFQRKLATEREKVRILAAKLGDDV